MGWTGLYEVVPRVKDEIEALGEINIGGESIEEYKPFECMFGDYKSSHDVLK